MHNSYFLKGKHLQFTYREIILPEEKIYCGPILIVAAMAATAAAGGYAAYNQNQQGKAQAKMYEYQESLSNENKKLTEQTAKTQSELIQKTSERNIHATQGAAAEESKKLSRIISSVSGTQRAATGALRIGGVTAADIIKDTFDKSQLDQAAIRYNADVRSWEYAENAKAQVWSVGEEARNRVWAMGEEAKQFSVAAKYARRAGRRQAIGTLLSTAASVASIGAVGLKAPSAPAGGGGQVVNTGYQNVGGHGFVTAYSPKF